MLSTVTTCHGVASIETSWVPEDAAAVLAWRLGKNLDVPLTADGIDRMMTAFLKKYGSSGLLKIRHLFAQHQEQAEKLLKAIFPKIAFVRQKIDTLCY